ncbi:uncharacterized protein LOC122041467 [Zingiber officinale]|uniref:uncharacterized protein LOC122041467 n=1 Tax=Zingiber officinale TaxID=94328 RepID=UPI001C4B2D9C|nr:uncharacterized protein LOC122041467 [Zingiber officinale]
MSGSAQKWLNVLPNGSITCFQDFKNAFLRHFTSSRKYQKIDQYLFTLKQGFAKPLKSYIKRFNQVAQDVPSATSEILMNAFTHDLMEGEFFRVLIREPVKNFNEMLGKVANYINVEEAQAARRKEDKTTAPANAPANKSKRMPPQPLARPFPLSKDAQLGFPPGQC